MRSTLLVTSLICVVLAAVAIALPQPAWAADDGGYLGWLVAKKTLRQANKALSEGRTADAVVRFEHILAHTKGGSARERALYVVALLSLSTDPTHRDLTRARRLFAELNECYPNNERRLEIVTAAAWLEQGAGDAAKIGQLEKELAAARKERAERVGKLERELAATRTELAKKEEALQKIRNELINPGGG